MSFSLLPLANDGVIINIISLIISHIINKILSHRPTKPFVKFVKLAKFAYNKFRRKQAFSASPFV